MRLTALSALTCLVLAGCEAQAPTVETQPAAPGRGAPSPTDSPVPSFEGWTIRVSVEPGRVGPLEVEVRPVREARPSEARPWLRHDLVYRNQGDVPIRLEVTRTSLFLGTPQGRALLASDEGCGYERRKKRVVPGVCILRLDVLVVRSGETLRRGITLYKDLRGMDPLVPGAYVWDKVIRFRVGGADAPVRTATIRLTYELSPVEG